MNYRDDVEAEGAYKGESFVKWYGMDDTVRMDEAKTRGDEEDRISDAQRKKSGPDRTVHPYLILCVQNCFQTPMGQRTASPAIVGALPLRVLGILGFETE